MSDLDKLFENAPEGAVEVRYNTRLGYIKFFNSEGERYVNGEWYAETVDEWQAIATRPQPERKTVEDAVEWANGVWPSDDFIGIAYCSDENKFIPYMKGSPIDLGERKSRKAVCTREEFEACVAAKAANSEPHFKATRENLEKIAKDAQGDFEEVGEAKSEPEWTHVTDTGKLCNVIYEDDVTQLIETEGGRHAIFLKEYYAKPIKPTITKAEAWDKLGEDFAPSAMYMSIICAYEITD